MGAFPRRLYLVLLSAQACGSGDAGTGPLGLQAICGLDGQCASALCWLAARGTRYCAEGCDDSVPCDEGFECLVWERAIAAGLGVALLTDQNDDTIWLGNTFDDLGEHLSAIVHRLDTAGDAISERRVRTPSIPSTRSAMLGGAVGPRGQLTLAIRDASRDGRFTATLVRLPSAGVRLWAATGPGGSTVCTPTYVGDRLLVGQSWSERSASERGIVEYIDR